LTPAIADFFHNDDYIDKARADETTTLNVGQLADDLGTSMFTAFRDLQAFEEGGAGPFTGKLTAAQRTFLESQVAVWDTVQSNLITAAAKNGAVQTQLVDPVPQDSGVLSGPQMGGVMQPAGEQEVLGLQPGLLDLRAATRPRCEWPLDLR
jgi:flagellar hook-associated protein 3 FlgL